ncbi:MAG: zinc-binding dehydrogenase [Planctomycetes bacterium]|nr:zinc-binding dehydrogenase [Planctomycetota bacterium]
MELVDAPEPVLEKSAPEPGQPGDIIFEPEISCLCGSDLPYFNAEHPEFTNRQLGHSLHEMTGTVIATNGKKFRPGDKVLAVPVNQMGLFERYIVSEARAIPVDPRLPKNRAFLAQPLGTVIYALKKLPQILDKDVVIIGQGPIGQMYAACLRMLGAREIIAVEPIESRLALSPKMGATATINPAKTDVVAEVSRITGGAMADIVVEAVGHADHAFNLAQSLVKHSGRLLFFGVPPETVDGISWRDLFVRNVTIHTSVNPDFNRDFPLAMRWLAEGRLDLGPLVTHTYQLPEIQTAFETFRDRVDGAQKVVIEFPASKK